MEPQTTDALWALFYQRDTTLIAFFLAPLTALGAYAAHQWYQHESFLRDNPELRARFTAWQKRPDRSICPKHQIRVTGRASCPVAGCGWKPKQ